MVIGRILLTGIPLTTLLLSTLTTHANNCSSPISINSFPYTYSGTLCGAGDNFPAPLCGQTGWGASEDMVFVANLQAGATYEITVTVGSGNAGAFLFQTCDPNACIISLTSNASSATWCVTIPSSGTWYIVVDRDAAGCSTFSLNIVEDVAPPTGWSMFNGTINTCSGTLYDPGGPNCNYGDNQYAQTVICPTTPGQCIQLDFTSFDLENTFDYLDVYDGDECANTPIASYTGNTSPGTVTATGLYGNGCLTLVFSSDGSVNYTGFSANISCVPCSASPISGSTVNMQSGIWYTCGGTFYDSGGPLNDYSNNEDYTLVICPSTPGQYITVNFTSFNIENNFDYLYIYDGIGSCGTCLGEFTGTTSPGTITASSSNGCLTFQFQSDGSITYPGWQATISCSSTPGANTSTGSSCLTPLCLLNTNSGTYTPFNTLCGDSWNFPACGGCPSFNNVDYPYFFTFTIASGGTLLFTITPSGTHDLDWALWQIPDPYDCSSLGPPIRASWDAPPPYSTGLAVGETDVCECASGSGYVAPLTVNAGESYLLVINDWSAPPPEDFTLDFTGTTATFSNNTDDCPSNVLPLAFIKMEAHPQKEGIELTWYGIAPEGIDGRIQIWKESPDNPKARQKIHERLANPGPFQGSFIDYTPETPTPTSPAMHVYRIVLYDVARHATIAEDRIVVTQNATTPGSISYTLGTGYIQLLISGTGEQPPTYLRLYSLDGKTLWQWNTQRCGIKTRNPNTYTFRIPTHNLQQGIYLLEVEWLSGQRSHERIILTP